jgi:hypothetical protein
MMTDFNKAIEEAKKDMLPYESWEQLNDESPGAFKAFCAFRDFEGERNIRKASESYEAEKKLTGSCYKQWRTWAVKYHWRKRVSDFDRYIESLKQTELRKTIEAQGKKHRETTGKMLDVVLKKLDMMNPEELTQGNVSEWVQTAIKAEREAAGLTGVIGNAETKQGEITFAPEFNGL